MRSFGDRSTTTTFLLALLGAAALPSGAAAQNLLESPSFDRLPCQCVPFFPWTYGPNPAEWSMLDAHGTPGSGSALLIGLRDPGDPSNDVLSQEVAVDAPGRFSFGAQVRIPAHEGLAGEGWVRLTPGQTGAGESIADTPHAHPDGNDGWRALSAVNVDVPSLSVLRVELHLQHASSGGDMRVFFDDAYLVRVEPCVPGGTSLCVDHLPGDRRFKVDVEFATAQSGGASGVAQPVDLAGAGIRGGFFWMFAAHNPEILVKVLDGCAVNGSFWVFYSASTNVEFRITVLDTVTGHVLFRSNPDLHLADSVAELGSLPCS